MSILLFLQVALAVCVRMEEFVFLMVTATIVIVQITSMEATASFYTPQVMYWCKNIFDLIIS